MSIEVNQSFDFSLDALFFQKRLLKKLLEEKKRLGATELTDDELEFVNAAGIPTPLKEDDSGNDFPPIPL